MSASRANAPRAVDLPGVAAALSALRDSGAVVEVLVEGASMDPTLADGAVVRLRGGRGEGPSSASVVAFLAGGRRLTIHRIVYARAGDPFALSRGDANLFCDPPLPVSDIVGAVVARKAPDGGWEPLPEPPRRSGWTRAVSRANRTLMIHALRVHVRLAQGVALACLAMVAPRALARYGASARAPALRMLRLRRN